MACQRTGPLNKTTDNCPPWLRAVDPMPNCTPIGKSSRRSARVVRTGSRASRIPERTAARTAESLCAPVRCHARPSSPPSRGTQLVAQIPPDTQDDDMLVEMPPFEQFRVGWLHSTPYASAAESDKFAPETIGIHRAARMCEHSDRAFV